VSSSLQNAKPELSLENIRVMMHSILLSVANCHANQIIHRNVKPSKFLIGSDGSCHMTSFTSSLMGGGAAVQRPLMPRMGTTQYLAPEVLLGAADLEFDYTSYTDKVDMWAAGLILAEMSGGGPLFVVDSEIDLLFSIMRMLGTPTEESWPGVKDLACSITDFPSWRAKNLEDVFPILGSQGCNLLSGMLCYNPTKRLSAMQALRDPFFTNYGLEPFVFDAESVPAPLKAALP
jgi:serine/threonine protein kinase